MWWQVVNTLLGLWIMVSPAVFHPASTAADNSYIVGPLVMTFAIIACWEINRAVKLANVFTGGWLIISPLILTVDPKIMIISNVLSGILIVINSLIKDKRRINYGGGWIALFQKDPIHLRESKSTDMPLK